MLTLIGRYTWTDCKLGGKVQNEEMCFSYGSTGYNKVGAEAVARFRIMPTAIFTDGHSRSEGGSGTADPVESLESGYEGQFEGPFPR